jgi:colanic acid/amylovoran biosynthesis protein
VGPFDADPAARELFARHLRSLSLITAREPDTVAYLAGLGCAENVRAVADPAFLMPGQGGTDAPFERTGDSVVLGVNFSSAALAHLYGGRGRLFEERCGVMVECLRRLLADARVRVLLVPHVLDPGEALNDDHAFLEYLLRAVGEGEERIRLLPRGLGAARTKGVLAGLHAVVAARMHCSVAALSSGVPTLLLGYSAKARGMARYVYGDDRWHLPVPELAPDVLWSRVDALLRERGGVREALLAARPAWEAAARAGAVALADLLGAGRAPGRG